MKRFRNGEYRISRALRRRTTLAVALLIGAAAVPGCMHSVQEKESSTGGHVYFPALPEQPRYVFEGTLRNSASIRRLTDADRLRLLVTGQKDSVESFDKPYAVAARRGRIYVTDSENRRVYVFDVPRGKLFSFGHSREGTLRKPVGIAIDDSQRVYVADVTARRVVVYDGLGLYQRALGGNGQLVRPTGVAVNRDGSRIYVVDTGGVETDSHRVVVYDASGRSVRVIGARGGEPGMFNYPVDAGVAPDGTLYVLDAGNFRVQAFDRQGRFLRAFGSVGNGLGQFARPRGLTIDGEGNVYVSDAAFANVQVFDPNGQLLLAIGRSGQQDEPGRYRLPAGLAVDETQRLYVVDQYFSKVEVLRRLGEEEGRRIAATAVQ